MIRDCSFGDPPLTPATPLPWTRKGSRIFQGDTYPAMVASADAYSAEDRLIDAAYIVEACNSYPQLVEKLAELTCAVWQQPADEYAPSQIPSAVAEANRQAQSERRLKKLLKDCRREIRLVHARDGIVYDPTLTARIDAELAQSRPIIEASECDPTDKEEPTE